MAGTERGRWPAWQIAAGAVALGLVAWGAFHPELRPDPQLVSPSVREELARTGFKATQGVATAEFESSESDGVRSESAVMRQRIAAIDAVLTEKRGRRQSKATTEESNGLYAGPIAVVHLRRIWPPLIGELLPYSFWTSTRMLEFRIEERHDFPHTRGGKLVATVSYEDRYADGRLVQTERRRLRCTVKQIVSAASIHSALAGAAALIECNEPLDAGRRSIGADNPDTAALGSLRFAHWYVFDHGWSIPLEGDYEVSSGGEVTVYKWKTKLISFE